MRIYIASSWKNQHAVDMLTDLLEKQGHKVFSFVRNANEEPLKATEIANIDEWIWSDRGTASFRYDTESAASVDLVAYVGPSGTDAWAEIGVAYQAGVPILGLWAKSEQAGLMRRMIEWFTDYRELLKAINDYVK